MECMLHLCVLPPQRGPDGEDHIRVGKLNLVDLAGSERQAKTGSTVGMLPPMCVFECADAPPSSPPSCPAVGSKVQRGNKDQPFPLSSGQCHISTGTVGGALDSGWGTGQWVGPGRADRHCVNEC